MYKGRLRWFALLAGIAAITTAVFMMRGRSDTPTDLWSKAPAELRAVLWPNAHPVAPFRMLTQQRQVFSAEQLRGRWSLVFFGYLGCPDVCPTTLLTMADLHRRLAEKGDDAATQFVFISVDPANDTPERLAPYLAYFDPSFIGLSGEPAQLAALARSLGAAYAEHVDARGVRSMEHSTSIVLVNPQGWVVGAFPAPHDPARMQQQFEHLTRIKYNPATFSI